MRKIIAVLCYLDCLCVTILMSMKQQNIELGVGDDFQAGSVWVQ